MSNFYSFPIFKFRTYTWMSHTYQSFFIYIRTIHILFSDFKNQFRSFLNEWLTYALDFICMNRKRCKRSNSYVGGPNLCFKNCAKIGYIPHPLDQWRELIHLWIRLSKWKGNDVKEPTHSELPFSVSKLAPKSVGYKPITEATNSK